jgi:hypothetical protein
MHNKAPLPETTQKLSTTETTLGDTSPNLTALEEMTTLMVLVITHLIITYQFQDRAGLLATEFTQYEPTTLLGATPTYIPETTKSPEERKERTQIQDQQGIHYKRESVKITRARKTTRRRIHHNTTSESRETRNPNTKPKPETSNQQWDTTTLDNHSHS